MRTPEQPWERYENLVREDVESSVMIDFGAKPLPGSRDALTRLVQEEVEAARADELRLGALTVLELIQVTHPHLAATHRSSLDDLDLWDSFKNVAEEIRARRASPTEPEAAKEQSA